MPRALPAALGAFGATAGSRPIVSISGGGGLGQYLAEFTTVVKYAMPITHVVLNNDELAKIHLRGSALPRGCTVTGRGPYVAALDVTRCPHD